MAVTTAGTPVNLGVVSRHQVQLVTEEVSPWLGNRGVALQKKYSELHFLALLTAALHQLYTLKDAWRSCTPTVLLRRPHSSSADGLDAQMRGSACSLKAHIHCYLLTNSRVRLHHFIPSLGLSSLVSVPQRIRLHRVHIFHWFHIMSLKRVTCVSVYTVRERRKRHSGRLWMPLDLDYNIL